MASKVRINNYSIGRRLVLFPIIFVGFAYFCYQSIAQELGGEELPLTSNYSIQGSYHRGFMYPHHIDIQFYNEDFINGYELRLAKSFPKIRSYRPPTIGVGAYFSNLGNAQVYGNVLGTYVFFTSKYFTSKYFSVGTSVSSGLGYVSNPFNSVYNPVNQAIGTHLNAFIMLSADLQFFITPKLSVVVSPTLTHVSNGKMKLPNTGLNIFAAQLAANYLFSYRQDQVKIPYNMSITNDKNRLSFLLTGGLQGNIKQNPTIDFVSSTLVEYSRSINHYGRIGVGLDIFYISNTAIVNSSGEVEFMPNSWSGGSHLSYEIVWDNLSFVLQPGVRFFNNNPSEPTRFSRVGIRYNLAKKYIFNCSIKTNRFTAEYIEWGIGYHFSL